MKNVVIFAAWMPRIDRAQIYVDKLKEHYGDCDVYIGINPGSVPEFEALLRANGFSNIVNVDPEIAVNSDASAFQAALFLLKESGKTYKTVYFLHTKGVSYATDKEWMDSCESYFVGFCIRRNLVDAEIIKDGIGGVSYVGRNEPMNGSGYSTVLDKYYWPKEYGCENIMSLTTFYAVRYSIVKEFLDECIERFFIDQLDRYFFEASWPLLVDRAGFKRHHLVMW